MNKVRGEDPAVAAQKKELRGQIEVVFGQMVHAASRVPKKILEAKQQEVIKWKEFAMKWFSQAERGAPLRMSVPRLEIMLEESRSALRVMQEGF